MESFFGIFFSFLMKQDFASSIPEPEESSLSSFSLSSEESMTSSYSDEANDPFLICSSFCLDGKITDRSAYPVACGGFSDIWKASLNGQPVAVKILRGFAIKGSLEQKQRKALKACSYVSGLLPLISQISKAPLARVLNMVISFTS